MGITSLLQPPGEWYATYFVLPRYEEYYNEWYQDREFSVNAITNFAANTIKDYADVHKVEMQFVNIASAITIITGVVSLAIGTTLLTTVVTVTAVATAALILLQVVTQRLGINDRFYKRRAEEVVVDIVLNDIKQLRKSRTPLMPCHEQVLRDYGHMHPAASQFALSEDGTTSATPVAHLGLHRPSEPLRDTVTPKHTDKPADTTTVFTIGGSPTVLGSTTNRVPGSPTRVPDSPMLPSGSQSTYYTPLTTMTHGGSGVSTEACSDDADYSNAESDDDSAPATVEAFGGNRNVVNVEILA